MARKYTQADRPLRIRTVLENDVLLLSSFRGQESVSRPYRFALQLVSEEAALDPKELLGTPAVLELDLPDGGLRYIHGILSRFAQGGREDDLTVYDAELVPWLAFLSQTRDNRIFQKLTVLDIVEKVFNDLGFADFELRCSGSYPELEYVVQYRETHLAFISRWLEREGIFYYFKHTEDKHVMVITDDSASLPACPTPDVAYMSTRQRIGQDVVTHLKWQQSVYIGKVTIRDYDYLQPNLSLESALEGEGTGEVYLYPGGFTTREAGDRYARLLLEAEEARRHVIRGEGSCRMLTSGHTFTLEGHARADANTRYMALEAKHTGKNGDYRTAGDTEAEYTNRFFAIPASVTYRPRRITPKPIVRGSQTAVVVGPPGEEVYTDRHGRVKIQFHWDREGRHDENSSCWVRVSSPWGGKGWGGVTLPRIGNEVVVDFLEGDPDRPIITGAVYNADQTPPFGLPDAGIQMGMKSRSSPGGGGYNEVSMTDTKGKEQITIHGQYDMSTTVLHDDTQAVKNDRTITVDGKHTETIKKDTSITVTEGNLTVTIVAGTATVSVKKAVTENFDATQSTTAKKKISITSAEADIHLTAATEITLVSGDSSLVLKKDGTIKLIGKKVQIEGKDQVNVDGKKISVAGGDEAKLGVGNQNVTCDKTKVGVSGAAINSSAVGMHEITGAVVKIN
jgi:type VI secretion system secreted protein VgrG